MIAFLMLAGVTVTAYAQRQYAGLPFPPYEIFEAMSAFADHGDLDRLGAAGRRIEPLLAVLDADGTRGLRVALESSVERGDREAARRAVLEIVCADLRFNLRRAREDGGRRAELLQMAFMDFHFLLPTVRERDPARAAAVRRAFRGARTSRGLDELDAGLADLERLWRR